MQLPFTREQFFDLFAAYNDALWPAVVALWVASTVIVARRLQCATSMIAGWRPHGRALGGPHLAYHVALFTSINPAAWLFAALFLGQAVLIFRVGVVQRRLSFAPWGNAWAPLAWACAYSLAYPVVNAIDHRSLLENPDVRPSVSDDDLYCWRVDVGDAAVLEPLGGSSDLGIGGSAPFLLGVYADVALPIAGVALAIFSVKRTTPERGAGLPPVASNRTLRYE